MNILQTRAHEINDEERIPFIMNWLDQEGTLHLNTFMQEEKEKCKTTKGLFSVLSNRLKSCHNHSITFYNTKNCAEKAVRLSGNGWVYCEQRYLSGNAESLTDLHVCKTS